VRFKLDEHIPRRAIALLHSHGHSGRTVIDQNLRGASDERLLDVCRKTGELMITADLDFANIRQYPPGSYPGVVTLRLRRNGAKSVLAALERLFAAIPARDFSGRLLIVTETAVRIRSASGGRRGS